MAIHVLENYVSVEQYAVLCGKSRRAIMDRIRGGSISAIKVDGYYAINTVANPPKNRVNPHHGRKAGAHVSHHELRCVISWCNGKGIRCYPYLRAIINGQLEGWLIGEEVFAKATDLEAFRKR